jgi:PDZ domain-containing secreted protein
VPTKDYEAANKAAAEVKVVEVDTLQQAIDFLNSLAQ